MLGAILLLLILILHFGNLNPTMLSPKIEPANVGFEKPMNKSLHVRLQDEVKEAVAESKRLRDALVEATTAASAQTLTLEQMKRNHTEESKNFLLEKKVLVKRLSEKMEKDTEEHLEKKMVEDHTKVPGTVPLSIDVGGVEFAGRKDNSCKDEPKKLAAMMSAEEQQLLESYMTPTTRYFEWGSGGSTDTYSRLTSNTVVSIENYKGWCDKVSSLPYVKCREREGNLFYKCIVPYPTIQYGYPEDPANNGKFDEYINAIEEYQNFDVVLVDARWRVACALKALDYITDDTVVFMHDMGPRRTYYDSVFKWYKEIKRADSLVAMRRRKNVLRPTEEEFKKYKYKPKW